MKKLIALLLALVCAFSLFSCGDDDNTGDNGGNTGNTGNNNSNNTVSIEVFKSALTNVTPKSANIFTKQTVDGDVLTATVDVTYAADGSSTIVYSFDRYGNIGEGYIVTDGGSLSVDKDGNYSGDDGFSGTIAGDSIFALTLDDSKLQNVKVQGSTLYAKVFSQDTAAVLGWSLKVPADIVVTVNGGKIVTFTVSYTVDGKSVLTTCEYAY